MDATLRWTGDFDLLPTARHFEARKRWRGATARAFDRVLLGARRCVLGRCDVAAEEPGRESPGRDCSATTPNFVMAGAEYAVAQNTSATLRVCPQFAIGQLRHQDLPVSGICLNHRMSDRFLGMFVRYPTKQRTPTFPKRALATTPTNGESWSDQHDEVHAPVSLNAGVNLISSDELPPEFEY